MDPSVSRVIVEGQSKSGRSTTVMTAITACVDTPVDDWLIRIGIENISILKNLTGFSSLATYTRPGSFRVVLIDDADELIEGRGTCRQLLSFLTLLKGSTSLKVILIVTPPSKRQPSTHKKLRSRECCDALVQHVNLNIVIPTVIQTPGQVIAAVLASKKATGPQISYLVGMRLEALQDLQDRISKLNTKIIGDADRAMASSFLDALYIDQRTACFDDVTSTISATIKIMASLRYIMTLTGHRGA